METISLLSLESSHVLVYGWKAVRGSDRYHFLFRQNDRVVLDTFVRGNHIRFLIDVLVMGDNLEAEVNSACSSGISRVKRDVVRFMNTVVDDDIIFLRVSRSEILEDLCDKQADFIHFADGKVRLRDGGMLSLGRFRMNNFYSYREFAGWLCATSRNGEEIIHFLDEMPKIYCYNPYRLSISKEALHEKASSEK